MAKQDDYTKTALRLPRDLHQLLTEAAAQRGQSLNAEMVSRLLDSFEPPSLAGQPMALEQIESLYRSLEVLGHQLRDERDRNDRWATRLLELFGYAVRGFDEAVLLARYKNAADGDLTRLQQELNQSRAAIDALVHMLPRREENSGDGSTEKELTMTSSKGHSSKP
jgi:hypothetical protein